jgi:hypothetical protein
MVICLTASQLKLSGVKAMVRPATWTMMLWMVLRRGGVFANSMVVVCLSVSCTFACLFKSRRQPVKPFLCLMSAQDAYELVVAQIERMEAHKSNRAIMPIEVSQGPWWPTVKKWLRRDGYALERFHTHMFTVLW